MRRISLLVVFLLICSAVAFPETAPSVLPAVYQADEQKLFALPPADVRLLPTFSLDAGRFACVVRRDKGQAVWLDGQVGPVCDEILSLLFSPDGKRLAYTAVKGGKRVLVLDGKSGAAYDRLESLVFSADGRHFACAAGDDRKQRALVDGQPVGPAYEEVSHLTFSPDGSRFAFVGNRPTPQDNTAYLVVGGQQVADLGSDVTALCFSPDGQHLAYVTLTEAGRSVVADNQRGPTFREVSLLSYSPTGGHFAYVAQRRKNGPWLVLVDGRSTGEWDSIDALSFGPDGRRVALTMRTPEGESRVVLVGKPGPAFEQVLEPVTFSPHGQVAYAVKQSEYGIVLDGKLTVPDELAGITPDEQERTATVGSFSEIGPPVFSTDGNHLAYFGSVSSNQCHLVVDRQAGPAYTLLGNHPPPFAADGSLTYVAVRGNTLYRVTRRPLPDPIAALDRSALAGATVVPRSEAARKLATDTIAQINDRYVRLYKTNVTGFVATCEVRREAKPVGTLTLTGDKATGAIQPQLKSALPPEQQADLLELVQTGLGLSSLLNSQADQKLYAVRSQSVVVLDGSDGVKGNDPIERATLFATDDGRYLGTLVRLKDGTEIEERLEPRRDRQTLYLDSARLLARTGGQVAQDVQFHYTFQQRNGFLFLGIMTVNASDAAGKSAHYTLTVEDVRFETKGK